MGFRFIENSNQEDPLKSIYREGRWHIRIMARIVDALKISCYASCIKYFNSPTVNNFIILIIKKMGAKDYNHT